MTHNKIETLQIELQTNPKSLSFAQLADLYLAQNMIDEAENLLNRSLKYHPHSVSGHMLLGRILLEKNKATEALIEFNFCIQKAPTNWACFLLRAQAYLKLKKHAQALDDFKQVLLHNPHHVGVSRSVARLETLIADHDDTDLFELKQISEIPKTATTFQAVQHSIESEISPRLNRILSLADAFISRQEYKKSIQILKESQSEYGDHAEIQSRLLKLSQFENPEKLRPKVAAHLADRHKMLVAEKQEKALKILLRRIQEFKIISPLVPN